MPSRFQVLFEPWPAGFSGKIHVIQMGKSDTVGEETLDDKPFGSPKKVSGSLRDPFTVLGSEP